MDKLLDLLYFSAIDQAAATSLPTALAQFLGGHSCSTFVFDPATGRPQGELMSDQSVELLERYVNHFHALDPWRIPVLDKLDRAVAGAELVPDADLARSTFYNEFSREGGMFHLLAAAIRIGPNRVAAVTTHRARNGDAFTANEVARLDQLLPHFARSMQMHALFARTTRSLGDAAVSAMLDTVAGPALICDGHGTPMFLNEAAATACVAGVPLVQKQPGSFGVRLPGAEASRSFLRAVADAARGGAGGLLRIPGGVMLVAPLPPSFGRLGLDGALAFVTAKLANVEIMADRATRLFRLSNAEAAISAGIAVGLSPEQIAELRSVKVGTVRTLVRRALEKTGCANLRQLTSLLMLLNN